MIGESQTEKHLLNEILADFVFFTNPELMKDEFRLLVDTSSADISQIEKYRTLLSNIQYAWQKTLKYSIYFAEFYPPESRIEKIEALNHHTHAYLQDADTLKNKIEIFLQTLKKDLTKTALNKDDVRDFVDAGIEKTYGVFENILKHRHAHVHYGMRFVDGDLLKAENAQVTLVMFEKPPFNSMLNPDRKPELVAKLEKQKDESFEVAKVRWVSTAQRNDEQISGFLRALLFALRPSFYEFLGIRSVKELIISE